MLTCKEILPWQWDTCNLSVQQMYSISDLQWQGGAWTQSSLQTLDTPSSLFHVHFCQLPAKTKHNEISKMDHKCVTLGQKRLYLPIKEFSATHVSVSYLIGLHFTNAIYPNTFYNRKTNQRDQRGNPVYSKLF